MGVVTISGEMAVGVALGFLAAYFGGWVDGEAVMRLTDLMFGFYALLTAILLNASPIPDLPSIFRRAAPSIPAAP